jgi:hypothetical protein
MLIGIIEFEDLKRRIADDARKLLGGVCVPISGIHFLYESRIQ